MDKFIVQPTELQLNQLSWTVHTPDSFIVSDFDPASYKSQSSVQNGEKLCESFRFKTKQKKIVLNVHHGSETDIPGLFLYLPDFFVADVFRRSQEESDRFYDDEDVHSSTRDDRDRPSKESRHDKQDRRDSHGQLFGIGLKMSKLAESSSYLGSLSKHQIAEISQGMTEFCNTVKSIEIESNNMIKKYHDNLRIRGHHKMISCFKVSKITPTRTSPTKGSKTVSKAAPNKKPSTHLIFKIEYDKYCSDLPLCSVFNFDRSKSTFGIIKRNVLVNGVVKLAKIVIKKNIIFYKWYIVQLTRKLTCHPLMSNLLNTCYSRDDFAMNDWPLSAREVSRIETVKSGTVPPPPPKKPLSSTQEFETEKKVRYIDTVQKKEPVKEEKKIIVMGDIVTKDILKDQRKMMKKKRQEREVQAQQAKQAQEIKDAVKKEKRKKAKCEESGSDSGSDEDSREEN